MTTLKLFKAGLFFTGILWIGTYGVTPSTADDDKRGSYQTMDYGPVIAESIRPDWPENSLVRKGLAIRLDHEAAMIFDTDLVRYAAGTAGGWIDISKTDYTSYKGSDIAAIEGRQVFGSSEIAGWASGGSFYGPRKEGMGNLPRDWAHYRGYYRHGDQVVLSYTVGGTEVLELPGAIKHGESVAFVRTLQVSPADRPMQALILEMRDSWSVAQSEDRGIILETGEGALAVILAEAPEQARLTAAEAGRVELEVPSSQSIQKLKVLIFEMNSPDDTLFHKFSEASANAEIPDLRLLAQGGPTRWDREIDTPGILSTRKAGYVIDRIPLPSDNPWGSWMRLSGLDFFEDGTRAAVSTWNGDVWIVSGIDETLENVRWRRYASGLFYPMGVAIVDEEVYVTERSQLTRLHDLNGDGEADYYENFNNDGIVYPMAHALELQVDSKGYFYFFMNGNRVPPEIPEHGALMRVSPDGKERELYSNGSRGVNTLGIDPDDTILSADQQGNWVPVDRIDLMKQGGFYGFRRHGGEDWQTGEFEPPVAWIPYDVNNSSGSLTYSDESRWGPLSGQWLLGSYGQANLQLVLTQEMGEGKLQGAVVELPLRSESGLVRGKVNPADGQLYLVGLRGWTTLGKKDGSFERIRYTGEKVYLPKDFLISPEGIELEFTEPLDRSSALNKENYSLQRWEYIYSEEYGSPEVSLENPGVEGRDSVAIRAVRLSEDGKNVFLEVPDMRSVMQMKVGYDLVFEDGHKASNALYPTVNWLSEEDADEIPKWQQRIIDHYQKLPEKDELAEKAEDAKDLFISEKFQRGKEAFQENCSSCHVRGAVAPSLETSEWAASPPDAIVRILLNGKRGSRGVMTPFDWMEDEEIASVVSYIRQRWHKKAPVTAAEVARIRSSTQDRTELWTEEELRRFED